MVNFIRKVLRECRYIRILPDLLQCDWHNPKRITGNLLGLLLLVKLALDTVVVPSSYILVSDHLALSGAVLTLMSFTLCLLNDINLIVVKATSKPGTNELPVLLVAGLLTFEVVLYAYNGILFAGYYPIGLAASIIILLCLTQIGIRLAIIAVSKNCPQITLKSGRGRKKQFEEQTTGVSASSASTSSQQSTSHGTPPKRYSWRNVPPLRAPPKPLSRQQPKKTAKPLPIAPSKQAPKPAPKQAVKPGPAVKQAPAFKRVRDSPEVISDLCVKHGPTEVDSFEISFRSWDSSLTMASALSVNSVSSESPVLTITPRKPSVVMRNEAYLVSNLLLEHRAQVVLTT